MASYPKARRALDAEWESYAFSNGPIPLKALSVREEVRQAVKTVHPGRIVRLCHEEGSELADGDPEKTVKGRSVLLGDNIKDQHFSWVEFCELGSSPPSTEAPRS